MALTNNKEIADKISRLRTHGITKDINKMIQRPKSEIWNYQQIELGFNYRLNDIQAALGLNQLKRLDKYVMSRHEIAKNYDKNLKDLPITLPWQAPNVYSSYHLYPILIDNDSTSKSQRQVYKELLDNEIAANIHYTPLHRHPYYENLGFKKNDFYYAEEFHRRAISIPIYATLKEEHQKYVIDILNKIFN